MKILAVGNIIARNTFLTWCLAQESFTSRVYRAIKDDGTPLMPSLWSLGKLERQREDIGTDAFQTEYQNKPPAEGTRPFREQWLTRRWSREELTACGPVITAADPSAGKTDRSDFQAIVSIRRDPAGRIFIIKADIARRTRKAFGERIYSYSEAVGLHELVALVFEANGFQDWVRQEIEEMGAQKGYDLPIVPQTHTVKKYDRVAKLSPIAEGGRLLFPPEEEEDESIKLLRLQLEEFPDGRHDDGPDALAMAVEESANRVRDRGARELPISVWDMRDGLDNWQRDVKRELASRRRV